jgi:hypothetical protein
VDWLSRQADLQIQPHARQIGRCAAPAPVATLDPSKG